MRDDEFANTIQQLQDAVTQGLVPRSRQVGALLDDAEDVMRQTRAMYMSPKTLAERRALWGPEWFRVWLGERRTLLKRRQEILEKCYEILQQSFFSQMFASTEPVDAPCLFAAHTPGAKRPPLKVINPDPHQVKEIGQAGIA